MQLGHFYHHPFCHPCCAYQLTGFYIRATLTINGLNICNCYYIYPANIYMIKVAIATLEEGVKFAQM